jgi:hypothetical protein
MRRVEEGPVIYAGTEDKEGQLRVLLRFYQVVIIQ